MMAPPDESAVEIAQPDYDTESIDAPELQSITREELQNRIDNYNGQTQRFDVSPTDSQLLSRFTVFCLIMNRTIASGIVTQPTNILFLAGSSGVALTLWVAAGLIILAVVACWNELALTVPLHYVEYNDIWMKISTPRSGGEKNYLEYIYKKPKFLMTCVFGIVFIIFGNLAGNALQFGVFVQKSLHPSCDETQECYNHAGVVGWAVFVLTMSAFINILTRDFTILINNIFAVCKVIFLVVVALMGIIYGSTHGDTCRQITWENKGAGGSFGDIALALFYAAYPYTGYEQPYYVLAEVKEPQRRFAKGTTYAMLAVLVLYPLVNVGYLCVVPYEGNGSLPVNMAITFFGRISGVSDDMRTVRAVSALLAIFIFGNIVAQTYTASRVKQEIGKEGIFGRFSLALATNNDALLARWLSPSTSRSPAINNLGGHLEQTPIFATFVHWLFEVILVLSFGIPFKPSKGYRYLTFLYTFTIVGVLGLLTVSGLLYLKVDSWIWPKIGRKWHEKARWKPWFDPIPCVVATLSLAFLLFAICVPPSARRPNDEPHWIMPLIGWTMPLVGVLWWSGLLSYLWKCRKTLVVKRLPLLDFDRRGQAVQLAEFVEVRAVPDVPDE